TYANGGSVNSSTSFWITNDEIRRGWAILASRGTTSLFFSRPDGSTVDNIWGNNEIGPAGDDNYFNEEVSAVNHFHNAMNGEPSSMKNVGNKKYVMISRGTKGAVIVNSNTADLNLNHATDLVDGTYTDAAHGSTFIVRNGTLTGTVKSGEIAVLSNIDSTRYTPEVPEEPTTEAPTTAPTTTPSVKTTVKITKAPSALYVKGTSKISVNVTNPKGATTYKSSSSKVAKVDSNGKVTALKKGTATITVTNNNASTSFKVTVKNPKLNKTSVTLKKGKTFKIKITGKVGSAKYKSSKKKIATVSSTGKVKAKKVGKANITVTTNGIKLKLKVKVKK
ncbi:MAG: Ig-like domain-containing protein, partial [Ruminococcus sp.]|nr:Ig-like domain-containing protein [Ruminococcus sp.]